MRACEHAHVAPGSRHQDILLQTVEGNAYLGQRLHFISTGHVGDEEVFSLCQQIPIDSGDGSTEGLRTFSVPVTVAREVTLKYDDICSTNVDSEADTITVTVDAEHEIFDQLPNHVRPSIVKVVAAMAAAAATVDEAAPEEMIEMSLVRLLDVVDQ